MILLFYKREYVYLLDVFLLTSLEATEKKKFYIIHGYSEHSSLKHINTLRLSA